MSVSKLSLLWTLVFCGDDSSQPFEFEGKKVTLVNFLFSSI